MLMYDSFRGTNQFGSVHKDPVTSVGGWNTGVKMPVPLLGKKRHRHNQRIAKMPRLGYPKISRYDMWLIQELQLLCMSNHGILLHPNITTSSQYISTNKSFGAVALHSVLVRESLKERFNKIKDSRSALLTLIENLDYLSRASGSDLLSFLF